jgi:hypothetical protein
MTSEGRNEALRLVGEERVRLSRAGYRIGDEGDVDHVLGAALNELRSSGLIAPRGSGWPGQWMELTSAGQQALAAARADHG